MASPQQGEIRVGPSHQAKLPVYRPGATEELPPDPEMFRDDLEELKWMPAMILDSDLIMYMRAAWSMAAFAGMCNGGSPIDGYVAAQRDDTSLNALKVLHESDYNPGKALQALVKIPVPVSIEKKWPEEDVKRFGKGLRQYGKNFFRIHKDLLPNKETKTPGANRPQGGRRRRGSMRRARGGSRNSPRASTPKDDGMGTNGSNGSTNGQNSSGINNSLQPASPASSISGSRPSPNNLNDKGDGSSGSEEEDEGEDDSDSRDGSFRCQHCYSSNSRDLQHIGIKEKMLLCSECRAYYKKYGELPPTVNGENNRNSNSSGSSGRETPYLFRPVPAESPDGSPGRMRTRNTKSTNNTPPKINGPRTKKGNNGPESTEELDKKRAKSPSASSTCSNSPNEKSKKIKLDNPGKGRKRNADDNDEGVSIFKRKREEVDSPGGSLTADSGSLSDDNEQVVEDNNDGNDLQNATDVREHSTPPPVQLNVPVVIPERQLDSEHKNDNIHLNDEETTMDVQNNPFMPNQKSPAISSSEIAKAETNVFGSVTKQEITDESKSKNEEIREEKIGFIINPAIDSPMPQLPVMEDKKQEIANYELKPKCEESFYPLSIPQNRTLDLSSNSISKQYIENSVPLPQVAKLSVKKEGLFENPPVEPNILLKGIDNFVPNKAQTHSEILTGVNQTNPINNVNCNNPMAVNYSNNINNVNENSGVKVEPVVTEDSVNNDRLIEPERPRSPPQNGDSNQHSSSPIPLTIYPINSSSPMEAVVNKVPTQIHSQSILVPAYPPLDNVKNALNIPNMSGQNPFSFYHPHYRSEKSNNSPTYLNNSSVQSEPQNLKIKQEVLPLDPMQPSSDPLQSLKDVKVPGFVSTSISQSLLPTTTANTINQNEPVRTRSDVSSSPFLGPSVENIKKEPEFGRSTPPSVKSPISRTSDVTVGSPITTCHTNTLSTPPFSAPAPPPVSNNTLQAPSHTLVAPPTSSGPPHPANQHSPLSRVSPGHLAHPHAFVPPVPHPHHSLMHHSLFAAAAAHAAAVHPYHPHHPYGYPYPFPYGPYPIPQPIPPPSRDPKSMETSPPSVISSQHHSSSVTRREVETRDESHHTTQEITQTHHQSSSTTLHHPGEKQTISHSSSVQSSSVQHKINTSKRTGSPAASVPPSPQVSTSLHLSATVSQTTSSTMPVSHGQQNHHVHHHQHLHMQNSSDRLSPSSLMMSGGRKNSSLSSHHPLAPLGPPTNSLEALRAHAQAAMQSSMPHGLAGNYSEPITVDDGSGNGEEDDIPSPSHHVPRGPSPEPKIEDTECHRSQSAIFLRHWNRGDYNSCCRTDLTFKPVPESKLARKREERMRKQAEKEREEREKQARKVAATPEKSEAPKQQQNNMEPLPSPYDRLNSRPGAAYPDTPALRQLSEYARPHAGFSPAALQRSSLGIPPQCIDPMLHYQMYAPGARERLELEHLEREKRERELRELRERELNDRLKEELMKSASAGSRMPNPLDPHWLDLHRRYMGAGVPPGLHQFGLYPSPGQPPPSLTPLERERLERLSSSGAYGARPPGLLPPRDPSSLGLHHPADLLARPYADQLAHQAAAHEHLQRQMLLERERFPHPLVAQHEEFIRQQRERELKVRALEEAARGSRQ